jgi:hypothetical protein
MPTKPALQNEVKGIISRRGIKMYKIMSAWERVNLTRKWILNMRVIIEKNQHF